MCWNVGMCEAPLHRGDTSERFRLHVFARSPCGIMTYIGRELRTQFLSIFFSFSTQEAEIARLGIRSRTWHICRKDHVKRLPAPVISSAACVPALRVFGFIESRPLRVADERGCAATRRQQRSGR